MSIPPQIQEIQSERTPLVESGSSPGREKSQEGNHQRICVIVALVFVVLAAGLIGNRFTGNWLGIRGGWGSHQFGGFEDVYLASDSPYGEAVHIVDTLLARQFTNVDHFVSVVGSFHALHLLVAIQPKQISFFDMNPEAVQWGQMQVELIRMSASPQEYISRLFARDVSTFEQNTGQQLTYLNQDKYMDLQIDEALRTQTREKLSQTSRDAYKQVMEFYQDVKARHTGWAVNGPIWPCEDRRKFSKYTRTHLGPHPVTDEDAWASFLYGEGFLSSQWTFDRVRHTLDSVPTAWIAGVDFANASPEEIVPDSKGGRAIVFLLNIFQGNRYGETSLTMWAPDKLHAWKDKVGSQGLVLLQTTTAHKSELVMQYKDGKDSEAPGWLSWSDWESKEFLPCAICAQGASKHSDDCRACSAPAPEAEQMVKKAKGSSISGDDERAYKELASDAMDML